MCSSAPSEIAVRTGTNFSYAGGWLDHLPNGVVLRDVQGRVLDCNRAACT